jgi:hypothetical protein
VANAIAIVRRGTFRSGWLTVPWERHIADAPHRLGPDGLDLEDDPGRIYSERSGEGTLLERWIGLVISEGPTTASADQVWQHMNLPASDQADRLVERVTVGDAGQPLDRETFMGGIDGSNGSRQSRPFDGAIFTPASRTRERHAVHERWARSAHSGRSQVSVLVESSEGLNTFELQELGSSDNNSGRGPIPPGPVF